MEMVETKTAKEKTADDVLEMVQQELEDGQDALTTESKLRGLENMSTTSQRKAKEKEENACQHSCSKS